MFYEFYHDEWLEELTDKEWRVYWQLIMLIHDRSVDGKITHSWHTLAYLLGLKRKNTTLFRILKKFHEAGKIVWENYEEFASRIPGHAHNRIYATVSSGELLVLERQHGKFSQRHA